MPRILSRGAAVDDRVGQKEIDRGADRNRRQVGAHERHAEAGDEDLHQHEIPDDRYEPVAGVERDEPRPARRRLGALAPRPALVPDEVVQDGGFDRDERRQRQRWSSVAVV
jgi:hypothetical protein